MGADQVGGAADTAAVADHALDKVAVQNALVGLQQSDLALFHAAAGYRLQGEVDLLLLHGLRHRRGNAAAGRKTPAVAAAFRHAALFLLFRRDLFRLKHGVQFLKGQHAVHGTHGLAQLELLLLAHAGADEDHAGAGILLLDDASRHDHGGRGLGDPLACKGAEILFHVVDEGRAAGGHQHPLFLQFAGLFQRHQIGAQCHRHHIIETDRLQGRYQLSHGGVRELTDHRGSYRCPHMISPALSAHEHMDGVHHEGFVHDRAEGTLVHAVAAGNALLVFDGRLAVLAHRDGTGGAAALAGAQILHDGTVGAHRHTLAAHDTLVTVDLCLVIDDGNGVPGTGVDATGGQTAAAGIVDHHLRHGTLVTGDGQNLHQIGVGFVAAQSQLHAAADDGTLLINTASGGGIGTGNDLLRNVQNTALEFTLPGQLRYFAQNLIFQFLNMSFKLSHNSSSSLTFLSVWIVSHHAAFVIRFFVNFLTF